MSPSDSGSSHSESAAPQMTDLARECAWKLGRSLVEQVISEKDSKFATISRIPIAEVTKLREEINSLGQAPIDVAKNALRKSRVLAFGETASSPCRLRDTLNPQRVLGATLMQPLKESGATHLAVEIDIRIQTHLTKFQQGGKLYEGMLPESLRSSDYLEVLRSADAAGLKIIAIAHDEPKSTEEYQEFATIEIASILAANQANKVVLWAGNAQTCVEASHGQQRTSSEYKPFTVIERLKTDYQVHTIRDVTNYEILNALNALSGVTEAVCVPTAEAHYARAFLRKPNRFWDTLCIYPRGLS